MRGLGGLSHHLAQALAAVLPLLRASVSAETSTSSWRTCEAEAGDGHLQRAFQLPRRLESKPYDPLSHKGGNRGQERGSHSPETAQQSEWELEKPRAELGDPAPFAEGQREAWNLSVSQALRRLGFRDGR